ncbi:MAG: 16S rRNA (cytidine(1402)-2'-O)-methyltransferase, partial [Gammaproteobacteria bacterium]|nr:16S rRNA (cytidine(1402)-2'-O)-methyltransferase [Gammaproteobacteria bacterium]
MVSNQPGSLYVVATPIGNLSDMSPRAIGILNHVAVIAAEDTRHTGRLLEQFDCRTPQLSLHEHNEASRVERLLERLQAGDDIALVSDAGTPLISDPGYRLVRAARKAGLTVLAVPGPSSITAALSVAGLPTDRFCFEGFLPARAAARRRRLEVLANSSETLVFFEAGRRLGATLSEMAAVFGGSREAAISRELTKRFETTRLDTLDRLIEWQAADANQARGEFVVMVASAARETDPSVEAQIPLDVDQL